MRWLVPSLILFSACGHAPPPPPKTEKPMRDISDISGSWTAGNEVDWGYFLTIEADGKMDLVIDRGRMGRCEQRGVLEKGSDPKAFGITFTRNECDREHTGIKLVVKVASYTGDSLDLSIDGDGVHDRRTYTRNQAVKTQ